MQYQYMRDGYTLVRTKEGEEKVKVVQGEIVESDRDEMYFLANGFQKCAGVITHAPKAEIEIETYDDGQDSITIEVQKKRGRKPKQ